MGPDLDVALHGVAMVLGGVPAGPGTRLAAAEKKELGSVCLCSP